MQRLILSLIVGLSSPAWAQPPETVPANPESAAAETALQDPTAETATVEFGGPEAVIIASGDNRHTVMAELATTPAQMQRGLMWRDSIAEDAGMLFHYDPPRRASMWMENTLIDLDLVFIEADGSIFKIIGYAQAGSRRSLDADAVVAGVLELPAGRSFELGIRPGDTVHHAFFGNENVPAETPEDEAEGSSEEQETAPDAEPDAEDGGR